MNAISFIHINLTMKNKLIIAGCCFGVVAVVLGAFAAHALKDIITQDQLRIFHTGVEYQFYHTMAILAAGIIYEKSKATLVYFSGMLFSSGIILFSGSLYLLALYNISWIGLLTPIGGLCFISGWILFLIYSLTARI
jgi:uncharacterized membrane protein YgdD (TMEM256/DUF423 family)